MSPVCVFRECESQAVVIVALDGFQWHFGFVFEVEVVLIDDRLGVSGAFQQPFLTQDLRKQSAVDYLQLSVFVFDYAVVISCLNAGRQCPEYGY